MKTLHFYILALLVLGLSACKSADKPAKDEFVVTGKLKNFKNELVYLSELGIKDVIPLDSSVIDKEGAFLFKRKIEVSGFYFLKIGNKTDRRNILTLIASPGERIEISADVNDVYGSYIVSGSKDSELMMQMERNKTMQYERVDSLRKIFAEKQRDSNFLQIKTQLDSMYFTIVKDRKDYISEFFKSNPGSLACIYGLYEVFGQQNLFHPMEELDVYIKVADSLIKYHPKSLHAQELKSKTVELERQRLKEQESEAVLGIGKPAPEIELNDVNGKPIKLSSLKGKLVLVDFWAGWCAPCRRQNPDLVKIYNLYKNKGFEIFGVSLDKDKETWVNAIKDDNLNWIQVSDLGYWNSPVAKLYNITSIPNNYLLDKNGVIIAKHLPVQELEKALKENL